MTTTTTATHRGIITRRYKTLNPWRFNPADHFIISAEYDNSHPVLYVLRTPSGRDRIVTGYGHVGNYDRTTGAFVPAVVGDRMVVTVDGGGRYRDLSRDGEPIVGIVEVLPHGVTYFGDIADRAMPRWFMD